MSSMLYMQWNHFPLINLDEPQECMMKTNSPRLSNIKYVLKEFHWLGQWPDGPKALGSSVQ